MIAVLYSSQIEGVRKRTMLPAGSEPLPNPIGTAPGIWMELPRPSDPDASSVRVAAMPGVPSEMFKMFLEQVRPRLPGGAMLIRRAQINCFGLGESHTEELLGDLTARGRDGLPQRRRRRTCTSSMARSFDLTTRSVTSPMRIDSPCAGMRLRCASMRPASDS